MTVVDPACCSSPPLPPGCCGPAAALRGLRDGARQRV